MQGGDGDDAMRANATYMLGMIRQTNEEAVADVLLELLSKPDEPVAVRTYAAGILDWMEFEDPAQYQALVDGLQRGPSAVVKSFAAQHPGQIKDPRAVPLLMESLASTEEDFAQFSAGSLGVIGRPAVDAVPSLCALLDDPVCECRSTAADALGGIRAGADISLPVLLRALKDEDTRVRREAAQSIGIVAREDGIDFGPAVTALAEALSDEGDHVAERAAESLEWLGPRSAPAVPQLIAALESPDYFVRWNAAGALGAIGPASEPAIPALIKAADDENGNVRREAVAALSDLALQPNRVIPVLAAKVTDPVVDARALTGLKTFGEASRPAIPEVIKVLKTADEYYTRASAAETLSAIGHGRRDVIEALTSALLNDEDETVRDSAADALKVLTDDENAEESDGREP